VVAVVHFGNQSRNYRVDIGHGMVEMCNTTMNLGMSREEVTAVAAVMNRDHYKFK